MTPRPAPLPLYRSAGIRAIEAEARRVEPGADLMRRAGVAAAAHAARMAQGGPVLVMAGPGNNGGDAFVVATELRRKGIPLACVLAGDAGRLPADAAAALARWRDSGGTCLDAIPPDVRYALVVDGLFGIGLARDVAGAPLDLVRRANASGWPILALDIPSGLDADTGAVRGEAIRARETVTFLAAKPGLYTSAGTDHAGRVTIETLGFDAPALVAPEGWTLARHAVSIAMPARRRDSHKGDNGSVALVGGCTGMLGAALLAGRAALYAGAGKVYLGALDAPRTPVDTDVPELMWRPADEALSLPGLTAIAVGPGLGRQSAAHDLVDAALAAPLPLVLDADALNVLSDDPRLAATAAVRTAPTVLTPHPAEAGRLLAVGTREVQANRIEAAAALARRFRAHVVVKGAGSVCADPDGAWHINTSGNPGMGSAGMGDVLTGLSVAFLAQGMPPGDALRLAVHLHGAAADALVERGIGPIGLTASEVALESRALLNRWIAALHDRP